MPANRRVNIHSSWFCLFKVAIHIYQICYNPCGTLSLGVTAMPSPIGKSASMIGGYYNKPVFIKVFLPILHGFPDTPDLLVSHPDRFKVFFRISMILASIICIPYINPGKVGGVITDTLRS